MSYYTSNVTGMQGEWLSLNLEWSPFSVWSSSEHSLYIKAYTLSYSILYVSKIWTEVGKVSDHGTIGPRKKFKFPENISTGRIKLLYFI